MWLCNMGFDCSIQASKELLDLRLQTNFHKEYLNAEESLCQSVISNHLLQLLQKCLGPWRKIQCRILLYREQSAML